MAPSIAFNRGPGGSDVIPVIYTYASATTVWMPDDDDQQGQFFQRCVPSVAFIPLQVTGNISMYQRHLHNYGAVPIKITKANLGYQKSPAYVDVVSDGVQYKVQIGATATVPANVPYLIGLTNDYAATILGSVGFGFP